MVGFLEYLLIITVQHRYRSFQCNTRYFDLLEHNLYFLLSPLLRVILQVAENHTEC